MKHEWVAIFTLHLTDEEAAKAYTFDYHGQKVIATKIKEEDGNVDVGCYKCEEPYQIVHDKPCKGEQL